MMTGQRLAGLLELEKKFSHRLEEALSLTRDLAESVDRQDQVSIGMLLSMRQKTILELQEIFHYIHLIRLELDQSALARFDQLLSGASAQSPQELPLTECIASNRRLLQHLGELDQSVSQRLCRDRSFYLT